MNMILNLPGVVASQMIMKSALTAFGYSGIPTLIAIVFASLSVLSLSMDCAQSQYAGRTESGTLYPIIQNGKYGFIDGKGRVVIKPQFLDAFPFSEGLAAVEIANHQNNKVAFIDTAGRIVFKIDGSPSEKGFSSGVAVLLKNSSSSSYYIDKTGKRIGGYYADCRRLYRGSLCCTDGFDGTKTLGLHYDLRRNNCKRSIRLGETPSPRELPVSVL
jgi:hypothetical protein